MDTDHLALVVDGPSLTTILANDEYRHALLQLGCFCKAVIACRVSPAQKQHIVKMVKVGLPHKPITLSIGDGANDVPMIQEAQIGVGISGKEGRQAVNASDFAIAQFRFLERLLLVHGRWNYRRISKVILYSFYKNIVLVVVLFLYACYSSFSGQSLYGADSWCYSGFNFYLGMPPFFMGFFDKDVRAETALRFQKLYYVGLYKQDLNVRNMVFGFTRATMDAFLLFFFTKATFGSSVWEKNGETQGLPVFGNAVFCNMIFAMLYKCMLLTYTWNGFVIFGFVFSVCFYISTIYMYTAMGPGYIVGGEYEFHDVPNHLFGSAGYLMTLILVPMVCFTIDFVLKAINIEFFTPPAIAAMEFEAVADPDMFLLDRSWHISDLDPKVRVPRESIVDMQDAMTEEERDRERAFSRTRMSSYVFDHVEKPGERTLV